MSITFAAVLRRSVGVAALTLAGLAPVGVASAEPAPPPPPPPPFAVNALPPASPAGFAAPGGDWIAFAAPGGVTCVIDRGAGIYGCSGVLPGAPGGGNLVDGRQNGGPVTFYNAAVSPYAAAGSVAPLPAGSRLSFRNVSCGTDGASTACVNSFDESGFVITPGGSWILNAGLPPLLARPDGGNPFT